MTGLQSTPFLSDGRGTTRDTTRPRATSLAAESVSAEPAHSHSFPDYGSGLVLRSNRGAIARTMVERIKSDRRRGSNAVRMADKGSYGCDGESELGGISLSTDSFISHSCEEICRHRIESKTTPPR
ncbi:unnamed protein product [Rhizoctonia solani]|uniref:Uncharacterized protein n=1 Tax=Rhizoctonia solani TaxID=456999 RepID=A0A8H3DA51_9AGAM|nr:unnamed protein product [Rhizoctonia solani]